MRIAQVLRKNKKKLLISLAAGLLCLFLSLFSISVHSETIRINIVWSVLFPIIVAMAYNFRYGLLAGLTGGAWFPFLIWAYNGYANLLNFLLLLLLYVVAGKIKPSGINYSYRAFLSRLGIGILILVPAFTLGYIVLFNKLMLFNPPFWVSQTTNHFGNRILLGFLIKDIINYTFLILLAEVMLHLPIIRNIFSLKNEYHQKLNHRLFTTSLITALIIWLSFTSVDLMIFQTHIDHGYHYYIFVLLVALWVSAIVSRSLINLIEARLEQENQFRLREEEFRSIFESIHAGIGIIDREGNYRLINKWWQEKLGYDREEIHSLRNIDITFPDDLPSTKVMISKLLNKEVDHFSMEKRYLRKDGSVFWGQLFSSAIHDNNGEVSYITGIINDITERKEAEAALIREKRFSSQLIEALPGIFYLYTYPELKLVLWNSNHEKLLGFTGEELKDRHILEWHPPEHRHLVLEAIEQTFNKGQNILESPLIAKDGTSIPFLMTGIRFETEEQLYMLGFGIDITDKKKAEKELLTAQQRQEAMIANIADVIAIIDSTGINRYKSPNIEKWFGWKPGELIGKSAWDLLHPEDLESVKLFFYDICQEPNKSGVTECRYINKKGEYKWIEVFAINCIDSQVINGVLINYKDISERKYNQALQQEVIIARKSAEFKQKFLANMSHEIRTPLTGVLGMAEILSKTKLDDHQKDYLTTLLQAAENLREIINLILDYSKIEAGKIVLKNIDFSLRDLMVETEKFFNSITSKELQWSSHIEEGIPEKIATDKHRVSQIIRNLVSNAVKFTTSGGVSLKITIAGKPSSSKQGESELKLKVEVKDTGKGINKAYHDKLFDPFFQVDSELTRNHDGTGLGLPICKELAELLGGEINFESEPGKGSTFWFTFNCIAAQTKDDRTERKEQTFNKPSIGSIRRLSILLVEDKFINQKVICLLLKSIGHSVIIAENGEEALKIYQPNLFDLILMDIQMPLMDGIEATRRLREKFTDLPPIIGLSANAFEGDREKYIAQGLDEYLTKPINLADFQEVVSILNICQ
jgi:PAS domain S-box-containing protein